MLREQAGSHSIVICSACVRVCKCVFAIVWACLKVRRRGQDGEMGGGGGGLLREGNGRAVTEKEKIVLDHVDESRYANLSTEASFNGVVAETMPDHRSTTRRLDCACKAGGDGGHLCCHPPVDNDLVPEGLWEPPPVLKGQDDQAGDELQELRRHHSRRCHCDQGWQSIRQSDEEIARVHLGDHLHDYTEWMAHGTGRSL